jgi:hypothetical protein
MVRSIAALTVTSALVALAAGCGGGVMTLKAKYPDDPYTHYPSVGRSVLVKVSDAREFQPYSTSLALPVYAGEKPSEADEVRIIGARSGEGGKDLSNIFLGEGQTVKSITADLMRVALDYAGYDVVTTAEGAEGGPDITADVKVVGFWIWMIPGALTIGVRAGIEIEAVMTVGTATFTIRTLGFHEDDDVGNSVDSYALALNEAVDNLLDKLYEECLAFVSESAEAAATEESGAAEPEEE